MPKGKKSADRERGRRIAMLRDSLGIGQAELATLVSKHLGVPLTRGAVGNWELGGGMSTENLRALARSTGASLEWLATGRGAMMADLSAHRRVVPIGQEFDVDPDADAGLIQAEVGGQILRPKGLPPDAIVQPDFSPGLGGGGAPSPIELRVPAPGAGTIAGEGIEDWWRPPGSVLRSLNLRPARVVAFRVKGNSMIPLIDEGDVVFADISHRVPSPPGIYVLDDGFGDIVCKYVDVVSRAGEEPILVRLTSENKEYDPKTLTLEEARIVGRYVGMFTTRNRR